MASAFTGKSSPGGKTFLPHQLTCVHIFSILMFTTTGAAEPRPLRAFAAPQTQALEYRIMTQKRLKTLRRLLKLCCFAFLILPKGAHGEGSIAFNGAGGVHRSFSTIRPMC